jgi:hypothetical protein
VACCRLNFTITFTVQEVKFSVKNIVRQRCAEGFNSGFKTLITVLATQRVALNSKIVNE